MRDRPDIWQESGFSYDIRTVSLAEEIRGFLNGKLWSVRVNFSLMLTCGGLSSHPSDGMLVKKRMSLWDPLHYWAIPQQIRRIYADEQLTWQAVFTNIWHYFAEIFLCREGSIFQRRKYLWEARKSASLKDTNIPF